jgi:hypothetical protein
VPTGEVVAPTKDPRESRVPITQAAWAVWTMTDSPDWRDHHMRIITPEFMFRLLLVAAALGPAAGAAHAGRWSVTIRGSTPAPVEVPVIAPAPSSLPGGVYALDPGGGNAPIPVRVFSDVDQQWIGLVVPARAASIDGSYELNSVGQAALEEDKGITFSPDGPNLEIRIDGKIFTVHHTDEGAKPFLFPLIGPTGAPVTRAFPMKDVPGEAHDHPHQRSFWFTHGKVSGVDFWSEQGSHGRIKETGRKTIVTGPVLGRLRTSDDWVDPDGRVVCSDVRVLTIYRTDPARVLDFDIVLRAGDASVTFGDTKEGMFGLRVASSMEVDRKRGGRITNAEGLNDATAWGKASPWVDYTGPVDGKTMRIAILNHPRSFRYPTTWHVRTYGLFAANPFGWHDFGLERSGEYVLPAGQELRFSYRVILHEGATPEAGTAKAFAGYAEPPTIEVSAH